MEFQVLHLEKSSFWGHKCYEIQIRVTLTQQEEALAIQKGILKKPLLGSDLSDPRLQHLPLICGRHQISMLDLVCGLTAGVTQEHEKELLLWLKRTLQERCREFNSYLGLAGRRAPEILFTRQGVITRDTI